MDETRAGEGVKAGERREAKNILTPENVLEKFDQAVKGQPPNFETMMTISFYMDFAIHEKDLALINVIHERIAVYFLEAYSRSYKLIQGKESCVCCGAPIAVEDMDFYDEEEKREYLAYLKSGSQ